MPELRDITVRVTDVNGTDLEEWGVQRLRNQPKISAYIKAQSNMAFRITVQAKIPYTNYELRRESNPGTEDAYELYNPDGDLQYRTCTRRRNGSEARPLYSDRQTNMSSGTQSSPIPARPPTSYTPPPPFDFLASLYLDGRSKPERRVVVYLDPEHEDFSRGGKSYMKSRWVQTMDGTIQEHAWVFNDIGIDTILDKLFLSNSGPDGGEDEDAMVAAMNGTGLAPENDIEREEKKRVGQIEVRVSRIVVGRKTVDYNYRPKHREGEKDDVDMDGTHPDLSHTAGLTVTKFDVPRRVPVIDYWLFDQREETYATFKFFYRSQETLQKFIPSFPKASKRSRKPQRVDANLTNITPLSISQGPKARSKAARSIGTTFEDRIKRKDFDSDAAAEFRFDDENRHVKEAVQARIDSAASSAAIQFPNAGSLTIAQGQIRKDTKDATNANQRTTQKHHFALGLNEALEQSARDSDSSNSGGSPGSGDSTEAVTSTHPSGPLPTSSKLRLVLSKPKPNDTSGAASASLEASSSTASPKSLNTFSFNTPGSKFNPINNSTLSSNSSTPFRRSERLKHVINTDYRHCFGSDADDEQDVNDSDIDTEIGEEDDDEVLPSQNRDDEGLHTRLRDIDITGKGKRRHDGRGSLGEGEDDDDSEEGKLATFEDGLEASIAEGKKSTGQDEEQLSKRVKKND